jgi:hypothetical protein
MPPFGPVPQGALVAVSVSMAVPALMVFLSLTLKASLSRWLNIIGGVLYSLFVLLTMRGALGVLPVPGQRRHRPCGAHRLACVELAEADGRLKVSVRECRAAD